MPDFETFQEKATPILGVPFPVYIMDSMMFIRGWNSYLPHFLSRRRESPGDDYHLIDFIIEADEHPGVQPQQRDRVRRAVMELWFLTSDACGSDEYKALLKQPLQIRGIQGGVVAARVPRGEGVHPDRPAAHCLARRHRRGPDLPFRRRAAAGLPGAPVHPHGRGRPGEARRAAARGPPKVIFDTRCHWAQTEEDEPFYRVS